MEDSAGIFVPSPRALYEVVACYVSGSPSSFTSTIKAQPLAFPHSLGPVHPRVSLLPRRHRPIYPPALPLTPGASPPCSEPLTTHLRLLRTTTSLGPLQPFLFNVHSFHFTTLPLTAQPLNPYGYRESFLFLPEVCLSHTRS